MEATRQAFGARLRLLREQSSLTGEGLARALGWHPSKISRLEHGRRSATAADVAAWVTAVGQPAAVADELLIELRQVQVEHRRLRRLARGGLTRHHAAISRLDSATTTIRALEVNMVHGLLQTPTYARHMLQSATRLWPVQDLDAAVDARMQRQQSLAEPGHVVHLLLGEGALRHRICPPAVMREQLLKLGDDVHAQGFEVRILPFSVTLPVPLLHGFWIFDDRLVSAETVTAELSVRDPDDIAVYIDRFKLLWECSAGGDTARALIGRALDDLTQV
ncbi:MAG: helix-turn-helix domain-containing protein [Pseudonocardia sp.]|nr:helix-turn-helix domain-containing protein [Pseudonocardia sp.]